MVPQVRAGCLIRFQINVQLIRYLHPVCHTFQKQLGKVQDGRTRPMVDCLGPGRTSQSKAGENQGDEATEKWLLIEMDP